MRQWVLDQSATAPGGRCAVSRRAQSLADLVACLGDAAFSTRVLQDLAPVLPAASWAVYRTGQRCEPTLFMSSSRGIPDTTQDCWWAYLSGPYRQDRTWGRSFDEPPAIPVTRLCHVSAHEVQGEHRARVYEAHGVAERVSVVDYESDGSVFAVNFYRHEHQPAFRDAQLGDFEGIAPLVLALVRKHIQLARPASASSPGALLPQGSRAPRQPAAVGHCDQGSGSGAPGALPLRAHLVRLQKGLTERELDVCTRLLQGMTHEGIAADLSLSVPTVKTYRNRAFQRLGIHFRNELFAKIWTA